MKEVWRNRSVLAGILGFLLFFVGSSLVLSLRDRQPSAGPAQPLPFNHRLHVEELELECTTCHEFVEDETFAGRPTAETCSFCHSEDTVGDSPEDQKLVDFLASGEALEWKPLFRQPSHVFYSHRRHVVVAGIECAVCHGDIASRETLPTKVERLTMEVCLDCHQELQAGEDCTDCHR